MGRYANRIGGAKFVLNGETFELFKNNGGAAPNFKNSLHGGKKGFDKYVWESKIIENGIELSLTSNHMDEVGFFSTRWRSQSIILIFYWLIAHRPMRERVCN